MAGAAALLYTAPVLVAVLGRLILGESLTPLRFALAVVVMIGVALTVHGGSNAGAEAARLGLAVGIVGGLLSAVSYAFTTLLARFAARRRWAHVAYLSVAPPLMAVAVVAFVQGHWVG